MKTRRSQASSPYSDSQYFWNGKLQNWTDLRVNCIPEVQLPLCRKKPSRQNFRQVDRVSNLSIDLRADLLNSWTDQEKALFTQRFTEVGKNFQLIADALPGKTVAQCIQYYYLTKHRFCYKNLRKRAIREKRGQRTRRVKSCGNEKGNKQPLQRLGNYDKITDAAGKGKLLKTYSCPESEVLESKDTFRNNKSRISEGGRALEDMRHMNKNPTRKLRSSAKTASAEVNTSFHKDSESTSNKKLAEGGVNRGKGFAKASNTRGDFTSDALGFMNHLQKPNIKMKKHVGKTKLLSVDKRSKSELSYRGKLSKGTSGQGNNNSTSRGRSGDELESMLDYSSNMNQKENSSIGNRQDTGEFSDAHTSRSHFCNPNRKSKRKDDNKRTAKVNHSYAKMPSGPSCSGIDVIKDAPPLEKGAKRVFKDRGTNSERKCVKGHRGGTKTYRV